MPTRFQLASLLTDEACSCSVSVTSWLLKMWLRVSSLAVNWHQLSSLAQKM